MTALGDFEQLVILAVMQLGEEARASEVRARIEAAAERRVTRGALYATLDRLEAKGLLTWEAGETTPARGGIPSRRFIVTPEGVVAIRHALRAVSRLAEGVAVLGKGTEHWIGPV